MVRVFVLVLAVGLLPLTIGALAIQRQSTRSDRRDLDRALIADANSGSADMASYFERARAVALLTSVNPVFREFYESPGSPQTKTRTASPEFRRLNAALAYLEKLYPAALGEASFIDHQGFENARVVRGVPAAPAVLSKNEIVNRFFHPTFAVGVGQVYQAAPYLSPDTHRWVISNSTVVPHLKAPKAAIVHFEITIESLRRALAREKGHHLLVVDRASGAIIVDSQVPQKPRTRLGQPDRRFAALASVSPVQGRFTVGGRRMAYVRVRRAEANANDWVLVAEAPSVHSSLIGLNRATLALLTLLLVLIALPVAYRWGRLNKVLSEREKDLHESDQRYRTLFEHSEAGRRQLAEQNDRLREVDRLKDEFVASVSHELRTPLTSISGYLELVLDAGELSEEQEQFLAVVGRNADRLLRVVGDLLFVAQLKSSTVILERAPVDLSDLVGSAVESVAPLACERGIELTFDREALSLLEGDEGRIGQAIDNLLTNALKFTPRGGRVEVRCFQRDDVVCVQVCDTGMGVAEEDQQHLFEKFFRTSEAQAEAIQGTGLGLSIVAAIVDAHGGSIEVESNLGVGTTFTVLFPIAVASELIAV
jgi:signal transduction histidine kinase